jgi:hypothetical protein
MGLLAISFLPLLFPSVFVRAQLSVATERRTALVIGNSNYRNGQLRNPVNNAVDIAAALNNFGFDVTVKKDANLCDWCLNVFDADRV